MWGETGLEEYCLRSLSWSPVGPDIALVADRSGRDCTGSQVWLVNGEGDVAQPRLLWRTSRCITGIPAWRHDGETIAISEWDNGGGALWVIPRGWLWTGAQWSAGSGLCLVNGAQICDPQWSPDDTHIMWYSSTWWTKPSVGRLGVARVADVKIRSLETSVEPTRDPPQYSPTGNWIGFYGGLGNGQKPGIAALYIISAHGSNEKRLDCPWPRGWFWAAPEEIIYLDYVGANRRLVFWRLNVRTGERVHVFSTSKLPGLAYGDIYMHWKIQQWNPECRQLLLVCSDTRVMEGDVYRIDIDDGRAHKLTSGGKDSCPCWSGDGANIAFVRGGTSLWVMNADGSEQREIIDVSELQREFTLGIPIGVREQVMTLRGPNSQ